jgi:hypothetical protein
VDGEVLLRAKLSTADPDPLALGMEEALLGRAAAQGAAEQAVEGIALLAGACTRPLLSCT